MAVAAQGCRTAPYTRRRPEQSTLYRLVQEHLETYLLLAEEGEWGAPSVPAQVEREFRRYLECGILAHGLLAPPWDSPPSLRAGAEIRSRRIIARAAAAKCDYWRSSPREPPSSGF